MEHLKRVRTIADFQFGNGAGMAIFPDGVEFRLSNTRRVRQVVHKGDRLATLRAGDGLLTLGMEGARRLHGYLPFPEMRVVVNRDAAPFAAEGRNAFAKHVVSLDTLIRAGDEVLVVDEDDRLLGTGQALLSAREMLSFKKGVAVSMRQGVKHGSSGNAGDDA